MDDLNGIGGFQVDTDSVEVIQAQVDHGGDLTGYKVTWVEEPIQKTKTLVQFAVGYNQPPGVEALM